MKPALPLRRRLLALSRRLLSPRALAASRIWLFAVLIGAALMTCRAADLTDTLWTDFLFENYRTPARQDGRIAMVMLSDRTLEELGVSFPLPRKLYEDVIREVVARGASVAALDIFLGPSVYVAQEERLARAARAAGNVIFTVNTARRGPSVLVEEPLGDLAERYALPLAHKEILRESGKARALEGFLHDSSRGSSFQGPSAGLHQRGGKRYGALCLEAAAAYLGGTVRILEADPPGRERPWYLAPGKAVAVGDRIVHLDGTRLLINYGRMDPGALFPAASFESLLLGDVPEDAFKGKIVFIGFAAARQHEEYFVPVRSPRGFMWGNELHAFAAKTVLDGTALHRLRPGLVIAILLFLAALNAPLCLRMRPMEGLALTAVEGAALLGASFALYRHDLLLPPSGPGFALFASYALAALARAGELRRELDLGAGLLEEVNRASRWREDPNRWLGRLLSITARTLKARTGWIAVRAADGTLVLAASLKEGEEASPEELGGGLTSAVMESGTYRLSPDTGAEERLSSFERRLSSGALLLFPLKGAHQVLGVLALGRPFPGRFTGGDVAHLATLATLAGALLDNVRLSGKIQDLFIDSIASLAKAVDARDPYTYGHSSRVAGFSASIGRAMGLGEEEVKKLELAGILHDIGKIGIPEGLLRKPEKLTDEEFAIMQKHPDIAVSILTPLNEIYALLPVIAGHHEKLDGTGYPKGLSAEEIPLAARILAVADVYDALTSERPYRKPSPPREAFDIMRRHFGAHLDMAILDVFEKAVFPRVGEPA